MRVMTTVPGQVVRGTTIKGKRPNAIIVKNFNDYKLAADTNIIKWLFSQVYSATSDFIVISKHRGAISDKVILDVVKALEGIYIDG